MALLINTIAMNIQFVISYLFIALIYILWLLSKETAIIRIISDNMKKYIIKIRNKILNFFLDPLFNFKFIIQSVFYYINFKVVFISLIICLVGMHLISNENKISSSNSDSTLSNIGVEILGIGLGYFLIGFYLDLQEKKKTRAATNILKPLFSQFLIDLFYIYKSSTNFEFKFKRINKLPRITLKFLKTEDYNAQIKFFNIKANYPESSQNWYIHLNAVNIEIKDKLETLLERYAVYLDDEQIKYAEEYTKDDFFSKIVDSLTCGSLSIEETNFQNSKILNDFYLHKDLFCQLCLSLKLQVDLNKNSSSMMWADTLNPSFGSARI